MLNDRVIYATSWRDRTQIQHQPIGLLEAFLTGRLDLPAQYTPPMEQLRPMIGVLAGTLLAPSPYPLSSCTVCNFENNNR